MNKPKVKQLSETLFEIPELGHSVKIQTKKGRKLLLCDCQNHTRFCKENPFCYHKQLVIEFLSIKDIKIKIDKLIEEYKKYALIKIPLDTNAFIQDLQKLQRMLR